jgi:hypothetical protein
MSGGGGGPIVVNHAKHALSDPIVHGQLPPATQTLIDPVLAKDPGTWTPREKKDVKGAFNWAYDNLA